LCTETIDLPFIRLLIHPYFNMQFPHFLKLYFNPTNWLIRYRVGIKMNSIERHWSTFYCLSEMQSSTRFYASATNFVVQSVLMIYNIFLLKSQASRGKVFTIARMVLNFQLTHQHSTDAPLYPFINYELFFVGSSFVSIFTKHETSFY